MRVPRWTLAVVAWSVLEAPVAGAQGVAEPVIGFRAPAGRLETRPGRAWKTAIVVSNLGASPMRLTPRVELPEDWTPLLPPDAFEVPPGQTNLLMLNAVVPAAARAGTYRIVVELVSHRRQTMRNDTLEVVVLPHRAMRVTGEAGPRFARNDTTVTVDFLVRNEGNLGMSIDLRAVAVDGTAEVRDSSHLTIGPGDSRYVAVLVGPTRGAGGRQLVELRARAASAGEFLGAFELLRVAEHAGPRLAFPLQLRLRGSEGEVTPSELSGAIAGRRDTFELMARRPGEVGALFGERDEYRARWSGALGRVTAGDLVVQQGSSPIRDSYEMLTGFDAAVHLGRVTTSAYYGRDRLFDTTTSERGAALSIRTVGSLRVGAGALERTGADSGSGRAWRAFTTFGGSTLGPAFLRAEVSGGPGGVSAYGVRAQRRFARAWFDVSTADVGVAMPGRERGSARTSIGAGVRLTRLLSVRGWAGRYDVDTLPTRPFAYASETYSAGFTFGSLSTEVRQEMRDAIVDGRAYASRERSARATIGRGIGWLTLTSSAELGESMDPNADSVDTPFQRFGLSAYLRGTGPLAGGLSLDYYSRDGLSSNQQLSGTLTTLARFPSGTRVEVIGSVFHVLFPTVASYSSVNARLEQTLGRAGHTIAVRARTFATTARTAVRERTTFFVEYGVPIAIPLPGMGMGASPVRARVVEAGTGRVVPGALVRMGEHTAITNRDGKVTLAPTAALEAGVLSIERPDATAPLVIDAPALATVRKDPRREVTISVSEGARVIGRITRYDRVTRDSVAPAGGIASVIVIATRGTDTTHAVTHEDGHFEFRQLAPGSWRISVSGGRLPPAYGFERTAEVVQLRAGRAAAIEFRVLLRADEATFQDGGQLTSPRPQQRPEATRLEPPRPEPPRPEPPRSTPPSADA